MCRLFGMSAGRARVSATFWLLDADDSLRRQSHANPDGTVRQLWETSSDKGTSWATAFDGLYRKRKG